ncbi:hypothetical protein RXP19_31620 [Pseudomonas aeruginosa]|nr:hypothetical protein [Pseudomonas aeruginosa]
MLILIDDGITVTLPNVIDRDRKRFNILKRDIENPRDETSASTRRMPQH